MIEATSDVMLSTAELIEDSTEETAEEADCATEPVLLTLAVEVPLSGQPAAVGWEGCQSEWHGS